MVHFPTALHVRMVLHGRRTIIHGAFVVPISMYVHM